MTKLTLLQRAMVVNRVFSYATLERQGDLSRSFVYRNLKAYENEELIRRAGLGKNNEKQWRLTLKGKRRFDPKAPKSILPDQSRVMKEDETEKSKPAAAVVHTLLGGREGQFYKKHTAEGCLWAAILRLKKFEINELLELKLANITTARQYVALLRRAGILKGTVKKDKKLKKHAYPYIYSLTKKAGELPPLMGRCFWIFDPNSGEYYASEMEKFEDKEWPGGAATPPRP